MSPMLGFLTVVIPDLLIAKGDLHTCDLYLLKDRIAHILNRAGLNEMLVIGGIDFALTVWTKAGITAWQPHLHGIVCCPMGLAEAEALLSQHLKGTVLVAKPVDLQPITWNLRTRPARLSITHKFGRDGSTQFDVSKARQSTPHDGISGRRIVGPGEIAAEPSDLVEVVRERSPPGLLLRHVLHEMIEQADLGLGQRESRWCIRV